MRTVLLAPILLLALGCAERHLIYLHGRIVQEQQSARPQHPEHGFYELDAIRAAFRDRGFIVHSEIRPKGSSVDDGADRAVAQVRALLDSGVPPDRITIVGASMGASIAIETSNRLRNRDVRFVLLGPCRRATVGRVLVIRDASDVPECPPHDGDASEIVIDTRLGHGYLYRPLPEWVEPAVAWARATE